MAGVDPAISEPKPGKGDDAGAHGEPLYRRSVTITGP